MGFGTNCYAKIRKIQKVHDKYTEAQISISHKNKDTNKYETSFMGFVKFLGDAHLQQPMENQRIKIISCDVSNCYISNDELCFRKTPEYKIFKYELQESNKDSSVVVAKSIDRRLTEVSDYQLPF